VVALAAAGNTESAAWDRFVVRCEEASRECSERVDAQHSGVKQDCPNSTPIAVFAELCRAQGGLQEENAAELMHVSVWGSSGQCLLLKSIFELVVDLSCTRTALGFTTGGGMLTGE
jgi:hypothetical protein